MATDSNRWTRNGPGLPWTGEDALITLARLLALTSSQEPLVDLLDELLRFAEQLTPEMRCSILLADPSAGVLRSGAAPTLPFTYTSAIDPLQIADGMGSCGTAAARREAVIVSDIAQSPFWAGYTDLAREHNLGACWSVPLMDSDGVLLGTCAMYYSQPRAPTAAEFNLITITGSIAALVIQRHRDAESLRASEARYRELATELQRARTDLQAILDNVPARITSWDAASTLCFANRVAMAEFDSPPNAIVGKHIRELAGEERYRKARPYIDRTLAGEHQVQEQLETQPDGSPRFCHTQYVPKLQDGAVAGLYALTIDVTDVRNAYERIRELAQRLETVREEERRTVALQLHEGIAQDLYATRLGLEHLGRSAERVSDSTTCRELIHSIDQCIGATRQIANDLQPAALAHLQLTEALKEHALRFGEISGLKINVTEIAPFCALDEATGLLFFRTAQEALTNVVRHARASRVDVVLSKNSRIITMDVTDDGVGIEESALAKPGSLGLLGIRERVSALGGSLVLRRNPGGGTTVSVHLPAGELANDVPKHPDVFYSTPRTALTEGVLQRTTKVSYFT
jgi:PAS domain S-box-containing protein